MSEKIDSPQTERFGRTKAFFEGAAMGGFSGWVASLPTGGELAPVTVPIGAVIVGTYAVHEYNQKKEEQQKANHDETGCNIKPR